MRNRILTAMAVAIVCLGGLAATADAHPRVNVRVKPNANWNKAARNYNRAFNQGYRYGRSVDRGWAGPRSGWYGPPRTGIYGRGFGVYF
ncbi:hypothetical protein [Planctomyces sp. SH-PL14]|uniref:hypothetical protein n=1 Tax=Planctomyces sp. SH-PL14 TaxID=1632864 RepID=UPI00078E6A1E|nr:hypothetical protein [Planctomyces sp. SH-PL14]AMV19658.1 hypothetical protein VT03_17310 [Planctomyces sp. SH-PL14]